MVIIYHWMKDLILYHWLHYLFQFGFLSKSTFFVPMHKFYALSDIWKRSKKKKRKCSSEVQIPTNRLESLINILGILKCEWNWLKLRNKLASSLLLLPLSSYEIVKYWSFFAINNLKIDMKKKSIWQFDWMSFDWKMTPQWEHWTHHIK